MAGHCVHCEADIPAGGRFCPQCGAAQAPHQETGPSRLLRQETGAARSAPGITPCSVPVGPKLTFRQKLVRIIAAVTSAQQRQAAFRGPHGFTQALRYGAGLPPMDAQTQAMYQAEALRAVADKNRHPKRR